jgi:hypothetical protein
VLRQNSFDCRDGLIHSALTHSINLETLRFTLAIDRVERDGIVTEVGTLDELDWTPPGLGELPRTQLAEHRRYVAEEVLVSEALWAQAYSLFAQFSQLQAKLRARSGDPDFFEPARSRNS